MSKLNWKNAGRQTRDPARIQQDSIPTERINGPRPHQRSTQASFEHRKKTAIMHQERERNEMLAEKNRQIRRIEAMQVNDNCGPGKRQAAREAKLRRKKG